MREDKILFQIKSLEKIIARSIFKDDKIFDCKLNIPAPTGTQMQIIDYILEHFNEDIYQKDLEDVLKLRRATVSGVLQTMEKNNLIVRTISTQDTRVKKIVLNEKAKEIFSNNSKKINKLEEIIVKDISKEELNTFISVISKMKHNIEENSTILN